MKTLIVRVVGISLIFISSLLHAATCSPGNGGGTQTQTISMGSVIVQRDAPIGTVIATQTSNAVLEAFRCVGGGYAQLMYSMTYYGGIALGDNIYKTNIDGVGLRIQQAGSVQYPNYLSNPTYAGRITTVVPTGGSLITSQSFVFEFIKTGDIKSDVMNVGAVGTYYMVTDLGATLTITRINMGAGNKVTQVACSISTPNIQVPLDDVLASSLTTVNMTAKPKPFNLGLQCDAGARINAKLLGTKNTDTSAAGVLQLTGAGSAGVAQGVGIQILYNGTAVAINSSSNLILKTSLGGQELLPFTAQYYQTKAAASVTTGSANATATLELTYQ